MSEDKLEVEGTVIESSKGIFASGEEIDFDIKKEDIKIYGKNSILISNEIEMKSDGSIKVNNFTGFITKNRKNSKLKSNDINISGHLIDGKFSKLEKIN